MAVKSHTSTAIVTVYYCTISRQTTHNAAHAVFLFSGGLDITAYQASGLSPLLIPTDPERSGKNCIISRTSPPDV